MRIKVFIVVIQFCLLQNLTFGQSESHLFVHPEFVNPSLGLKDSTSQLKSSLLFTFPEAYNEYFIQNNQISIYSKKLRGFIYLIYSTDNYSYQFNQDKHRAKTLRLNYSRILKFENKNSLSLSGGIQYKHQYFPKTTPHLIRHNISIDENKAKSDEALGGNLAVNFETKYFRLASSLSYFNKYLSNSYTKPKNEKGLLNNLYLELKGHNKYVDYLSMNPFLNVFIQQNNTDFALGLKIDYKQKAIGIATNLSQLTYLFVDITLRKLTLQLSYASVLSEWQKTFSDERNYYYQNHNNLAAISLSYLIGAKK